MKQKCAIRNIDLLHIWKIYHICNILRMFEHEPCVNYVRIIANYLIKYNGAVIENNFTDEHIHIYSLKEYN